MVFLQFSVYVIYSFYNFYFTLSPINLLINFIGGEFIYLWLIYLLTNLWDLSNIVLVFWLIVEQPFLKLKLFITLWSKFYTTSYILELKWFGGSENNNSLCLTFIYFPFIKQAVCGLEVNADYGLVLILSMSLSTGWEYYNYNVAILLSVSLREFNFYLGN